MEITSKNFWETLPVVLGNMALASHVSIDLKMTGIYSKNTTINWKTPLNTIYEKAKEAAERFQIVQFGLTCIFYDKQSTGKSSRVYSPRYRFIKVLLRFELIISR